MYHAMGCVSESVCPYEHVCECFATDANDLSAARGMGRWDSLMLLLTFTPEMYGSLYGRCDHQYNRHFSTKRLGRNWN